MSAALMRIARRDRFRDARDIAEKLIRNELVQAAAAGAALGTAGIGLDAIQGEDGVVLHPILDNALLVSATGGTGALAATAFGPSKQKLKKEAKEISNRDGYSAGAQHFADNKDRVVANRKRGIRRAAGIGGGAGLVLSVMDSLKGLSEPEPMTRSIEAVAAGREFLQQERENELIRQAIEAGLITS